MNNMTAHICLLLKEILGTWSLKSSFADLFMENMHSNVTAVKISVKLLLRILCPGLADQCLDNNNSYDL